MDVAKFFARLVEALRVSFLATIGGFFITVLLVDLLDPPIPNIIEKMGIVSLVCCPVVIIAVMIRLYLDNDTGNRSVHDLIVRYQHRRRQQILQRKLLEEEWAGVPDGAISRARPPGEPEPTDASLSVAEPLEDVQPRLMTGVCESTTEEAVVNIRV